MVFMPLVVSSQEILKADSITLKKGIYTSYEELKNNNPSLPLLFTVEKKVKWYGTIIDTIGLHTSYHLSISKDEFSKLGWFLGFCDGHDIYINPEPFNWGRKTQFEKLQIVKSLSYFERVITSYKPMAGEMKRKETLLVPFVIDIPMGNISLLNSDLMKEILSCDSALLVEFNRHEKNRNFVDKYIFNKKIAYKNYIMKLYSRHNDCRTTLRDHLGIFGLIDYIKEQKSDTSYHEYYRRVMSALNDNPYFTEIKLARKDYSNGNCKRIGIVAYHKDVPYYIGQWLYFDSSGKRLKLEEYDLNAKKIKIKEY